MAKKKSRSANVARKREKRNRRQKSKQKQLASEKQRKMQYSKLDEEGLFDLLMCSRGFSEEPEFENIHFDLELTEIETVNFFLKEENRDGFKSKDEVLSELVDIVDEEEHLDDKYIYQPKDDPDEFCYTFFTQVIKNLITPDLINSVRNGLSNCEKRFRKIGNRYKADAAFVSSAFFEAVSSDKYPEHPIFEGLLLKTLSRIVEEPDVDDDDDQSIEKILRISELIASHISELSDESLSTDSLNFLDDDSKSTEDLMETEGLDETMLRFSDIYQDLMQTSTSIETSTSEEDYPAKALYKNCIGIELPELLHQWQGSIELNEETENPNELLRDLEIYFKISEDRLGIYAKNVDDLTLVMENIEEYCQSSIIFLAKTFDKGGETDGTE